MVMRKLLSILFVVAVVTVIGTAQAGTKSEPIFKPGVVYKLAKIEASRLHIVKGEWNCLSALISRENAEPPNTWNPQKWNGAGSGAFGLPQALPGSKMASEGTDWYWNPQTQIRWMIKYSKSRYGGVCQADSYQRRNHWY